MFKKYFYLSLTIIFFHGSCLHAEDEIRYPMFVGQLANFGFWEEAVDAAISYDERVESQKNLYRHVARKLTLSNEDTVLDVGCGLGGGTILIFDEFHPNKIFGIDSSKARIEEAAKTRQSSVQFLQMNAAEMLNFANDSFDKAFSIEAVQHFERSSFLKEAFRVLKPDGQLVVASIFTKSKEASKRANELLSFPGGISLWQPIDDFVESLRDAGFEAIVVDAISDKVWYAISKWIRQNKLLLPWSEWPTGYSEGLYDYYVISAKKFPLIQ